MEEDLQSFHLIWPPVRFQTRTKHKKWHIKWIHWRGKKKKRHISIRRIFLSVYLYFSAMPYSLHMCLCGGGHFHIRCDGRTLLSSEILGLKFYGCHVLETEFKKTTKTQYSTSHVMYIAWVIFFYLPPCPVLNRCDLLQSKSLFLFLMRMKCTGCWSSNPTQNPKYFSVY